VEQKDAGHPDSGVRKGKRVLKADAEKKIDGGAQNSRGKRADREQKVKRKSERSKKGGKKFVGH